MNSSIAKLLLIVWPLLALIVIYNYAVLRENYGYYPSTLSYPLGVIIMFVVYTFAFVTIPMIVKRYSTPSRGIERTYLITGGITTIFLVFARLLGMGASHIDCDYDCVNTLPWDLDKQVAIVMVVYLAVLFTVLLRLYKTK